MIDRSTKVATSPTIKLLNIVGSPFIPSPAPSGEESLELYHYAVNNKIPLLYLDSLKQQGKLDKLKSEYEQRYAKYLNFWRATAKVSRVLNAAGIEHATVKSIKPYPGMGGDIDVIVFGQDDRYRQAVMALLKAGYVTAVPQAVGEITLSDEGGYQKAVEILTKPTWDKGERISPTGTDLIDPEHNNIDIDLQKDLATNYVIYVDKNRFSNSVIKTKSPDGQEVNILTPEFDLLTVIAHSLMEQLYPLGEFYTLLYQLSGMDEEKVSNFINIVKQNRLKAAIRAFATITAKLHKAAFGIVPERLEFVLDELGFDASEARSLEKNNLKTPHKYKVLTVSKVLLGKLGESRFRRSVLTQLIKMLNPARIRLVIGELAEIRRRETYLKGE